MVLSMIKTAVLLLEIVRSQFVDKKFTFYYFLLVLFTLIMFGILV